MNDFIQRIFLGSRPSHVMWVHTPTWPISTIMRGMVTPTWWWPILEFASHAIRKDSFDCSGISILVRPEWPHNTLLNLVFKRVSEEVHTFRILGLSRTRHERVTMPSLAPKMHGTHENAMSDVLASRNGTIMRHAQVLSIPATA